MTGTGIKGSGGQSSEVSMTLADYVPQGRRSTAVQVQVQLSYATGEKPVGV